MQESLLAALQNIQDWEKDARNEDVRYFFEVPQFRPVVDGRKVFIIGPKGAGKTAVARYATLKDAATRRVDARWLDFQNFPWQRLYDSQDPEFTGSNVYVSVWTYLILRTVCEMMPTGVLQPDACKKLRRLFDGHLDHALDAHLQARAPLAGSVEALGFKFGVKEGFREEHTPTDLSWSERNTAILRFIHENIDRTICLYVVFDDLDEDYPLVSDEEDRIKYKRLLRGLLRSVDKLKKNFIEKNLNIVPFVLLRSDIYDAIDDSNKEKWEDLIYRIKIDINYMKSIINYRIRKCFVDDQTKLPDEAYKSLISVEEIQKGYARRSSEPIFEYIYRNSTGRMRDIVEFFRIAAQIAANNDSIITPAAVLGARDEYSRYLKILLVSELHQQIPKISDVLSIFGKANKANMVFSEFSERLAGLGIGQDANFIAIELYRSGAIGNQINNQTLFYFNSERKEFSADFSLVLNDGLKKNLGLV